MDIMIEEMFKTTTIRTCNNQTRRYYKGKKWARVLWDLLHPESSCIGFDVHHRDGDKLNDNPDNLQRLTHGDHTTLHNLNMSDERKKKMSLNHADFSGKNNPMYGRKDSKNPKSIAIKIQGICYCSLRSAATSLCVASSTISRRVKRNKPGYNYIEGNI